MQGVTARFTRCTAFTVRMAPTLWVSVVWTGPFGSTVLGTTMNGGANGGGTVFGASFLVPEPSAVILGLLAATLLAGRAVGARAERRNS